MNAIAVSKIRQKWWTENTYGVIVLLVWVVGAFLFGQSVMSWWAFQPEINVSEKIWLPQSYQLANSVDEATCFGPDCNIHIKVVSVSKEAFRPLIHNFSQIFIVVNKSGPPIKVTYFGKEKETDTIAYSYEDSYVGSLIGRTFDQKSILLKDDVITAILVRDWVTIPFQQTIYATVWLMILAWGTYGFLYKKLFLKE